MKNAGMRANIRSLPEPEAKDYEKRGQYHKSISYKIRLSRESLQVRNDLVGAIGYWTRADSALASGFNA